VIDLIRERKPRFVAADVIAEYANILRCYGVREIVSDKFAAGFSSDEWARNGVRFHACDNSTSENYLRALPLLTSTRADLADNTTLRTQLSGLERRAVSGREVVAHARTASAHDDVATAVAGCLAEATAQPTPMIGLEAALAAVSGAPRTRTVFSRHY